MAQDRKIIFTDRNILTHDDPPTTRIEGIEYHYTDNPDISSFEENIFHIVISPNSPGTIIGEFVGQNRVFVGSQTGLIRSIGSVRYFLENDFTEETLPLDSLNIILSERSHSVIVAEYMGQELISNESKVVPSPKAPILGARSGYPASEIQDLIENANTSECLDLSYAFNAGMTQVDYTDSSEYVGSLFSIDLSGWDVSRVTDMSFMFAASDMAFSNFSIDYSTLSNWDVSNVRSMEGLFAYNYDNFDLEFMQNWDLSSVENLSRMFQYADVDSSTFTNSNVENWDVSNVKDMSFMFERTNTFAEDLHLVNLNNWDTSSVENMQGMFDRRINEGGIPQISNWDVSNVRNMQDMFAYYMAASINPAPYVNLNIGGWDVSNVTNMRGMFQDSWFNEDITGWDVSSVTDMAYMFSGDYGSDPEDTPAGSNGRFNQDISVWDVSSVESMRGMFEDNVDFDQDLSAWDISSVTDMVNMFRDCGMSQANMDATLIGWAAKPSLQMGVSLGGVNAIRSSASDAAVSTLVNTWGWTIT